MITDISGFGFFGPKMAVSWRMCFSKEISWNPYFYMVWGCALLGPSCQKREMLDTQQKTKFWLITEKFIFEYFLGFLFFPFLFFFGRFKGQVRWPEGPPHLALNPPYFCFFWFLLFFLVSLSFLTDKPCFLRALLFIFKCLPLFLSKPFWPPHFSFSLSLSLLFYFFLPSCFYFLFSFGSLFCLFLYFCFCFSFMKKTTSKKELQHFVSSIFVFGFLSLLSFKSPFLIFVFFFLILSFVFLFNIKVFLCKLKNTNIWSRGGCNITFFFIARALQNVKSYRFFVPFFAPIFAE